MAELEGRKLRGIVSDLVRNRFEHFLGPERSGESATTLRRALLGSIVTLEEWAVREDEARAAAKRCEAAVRSNVRWVREWCEAAVRSNVGWVREWDVGLLESLDGYSGIADEVSGACRVLAGRDGDVRDRLDELSNLGSDADDLLDAFQGDEGHEVRAALAGEARDLCGRAPGLIDSLLARATSARERHAAKSVLYESCAADLDHDIIELMTCVMTPTSDCVLDLTASRGTGRAPGRVRELVARCDATSLPVRHVLDGIEDTTSFVRSREGKDTDAGEGFVVGL